MLYKKEAIYKTFNIKAGEEKPVIFLILYSFFMGAAVAIFYTAATSLFVVNFGREILPISYIASGLFIYIISRFFSYIQKKFEFSRFALSSIFFLLISVAFLSITYHISQNKWLTFAMFISIRVFVYINGISFWSTASKIFNIQQAKRLFSFINTGDVISSILSYFSVPILLKFLHVEDLLYFSVIALLACFIIMAFITKAFSSQLAVQPEPETLKEVIVEKKSRFFKNSYFQWIFIMAFLPMFCLYFLEFIFFVESKGEFPDKNLLSGFLGTFFGLCAVIEFFIKAFVYGNLMKKYGMKLGLIILPVTILFCYALASIYGTFFGIGGLFFSFIVLSRFFMSSVRKSISDPAFQVLFQPIPINQRLSLQSRVEGEPKAFGTILAGIILLILVSFQFITLVHLCYIIFLSSLIWIKISITMQHEYRNKIKSNLNKDKENIENINRNNLTIAIIKDKMKCSNVNTFEKIYDLFEKMEPSETSHVLNDLLSVTSDELKPIILEKIAKQKNIAALRSINECLEKEQTEEVRQLLISTKTVLHDTRDLTFETLVKLAQSEVPEDRIIAANLLGQSRRYSAYKMIINLLEDKNPTVKKSALLASGHLRKSELWPQIIENLSRPVYESSAAAAIKMIGEPILKELDNYFIKMSRSKQVQYRIIKLSESIGGDYAIKFLRSKINYHEKDVRDKVLKSLVNLGYRATRTEIPHIKQAMNEEIGYIVWCIASIYDLPDSSEYVDLIQALECEINQKKDNIFSLLSLMYDPQSIKVIKESVDSDNENARGFAFEIIDMTLSDDTKNQLLPLFEDLPLKEVLKKFIYYYPQQKLSVFERLKDIINKDFSKINAWTKANAIILLKSFNSKDVLDLIITNIIHPDILIKQTALLTLYFVDSKRFMNEVERFEHLNDCIFIDMVNSVIKQSDSSGIIILDRVKCLKHLPGFKNVPEIKLVDLAASASDIHYKRGDCSLDTSSFNIYFYILYTGQIQIFEKTKLIETLKTGDLIGEISQSRLNKSDLLFKPLDNTTLLRLELDKLYNLMSESTELTKLYIETIE